MTNEPLPAHDAPPDGVKVVSLWLERLNSEAPALLLWELLDQPLRLALAQQWVMREQELEPGTRSRDRDDLAHALTPRDASHPLFDDMLRGYRAHWRNAYSTVLADWGVLGQTQLVAPDLEKVVITAPEYVGEVQSGEGIPAHTFITRLIGDEWVIAALARRLPVPGWPPTERDVS